MTNNRAIREEGLVVLQREGYIDQGHTGEAYAFFDSPVDIDSEDLRPDSSDLVLRFAKGEGNFLSAIKAKRDLRAVVKDARAQIIYSQSDPRSRQDRLRESKEASGRAFGYGLHARYGQSNKEAADQLVEVMRYVNGRFVPGTDPFKAAVLYKDESDRYVSRE